MLSRREKKWLFCRHLIRYWCLMDFVSHWLFKQTSKSAALKPYFMWCTCLLKHKHVGKDNFQGEILVSTLPSCGSKVSKMHRGDAGEWAVKHHLIQCGFNSLAWSTLRVLLLPSGWDAGLSQGYPLTVCHRYPFIHLGEERQSGVKFPV